MNANTRREVLALGRQEMSEENSNTSSNPSLMDLVEARLSRRTLLRASVGTAGAAVMTSLSACGGGDDDHPPLSFNAVAKGTADTVVVPTGYTATVLYAVGDPLNAATSEYANDGTDTSFEMRAGDHHDGIEYFGLNAAGTARDVAGSERGILAMNHEALTDQFLHAAGTTAAPRPAAEADKEMAAHGISVVEVRKVSGKFAYQRTSAFNRRINPNTPMRMSGAVRGHELLKTKYSPAGTDTRGTINNCGASYTPWGTYFSGEENWNGYFARAAGDVATRGGVTAKANVSLARYGKGENSTGRHLWETVSGGADQYARWNITQTGATAADDYRNEMNTYGYMIEVDPYDATSQPRKRTALGRFAHEMGVFANVVAGKPVVVYMGDDSRGEYVYKFVSANSWAAADANPANRITTGDKYLDDGKLYVAKYNADGTGSWIELNIANSAIAAYATYDFADQGDVLANARLAADAVGATKMDRPEWSAVHPVNGEIYITMTNNSNRKVEPSGSSQQAVDAANPRSYTDAPTAASAPGNINGHIIRMRENNSDASATTFTWDVYLFGAQSDADAAKVNLSGLTSAQDFSSPDGIWFSKKSGLAFVQTDDGAYTDVTNCMMLIAKPGQVGDGTTQTLSYTKADGTTLNITARVGAKPNEGNLRRFLVGPKDCEITGITESPDGKAIFVNIQHPGETISKANVGNPAAYLSHWPANAGYGAGGANGRPRSATIVITRNDGGIIGASDAVTPLNNY